MVKAIFESDHRAKVLHISFAEGSKIHTKEDLKDLRDQWLATLKSWHSPYKALVDCQNLELTASSDIEEGLKRLLTFLKGFFLLN